VSATVAVVIVNFNSGAALASMLDSLPTAMNGVSWEAVVVDNASSDASERATVNRERVTLRREPANIGFAAGVNVGLSVTSAPFVLLINPDCLLGPGGARGLLEDLQKHKRCAVVGPGIVNPDGTPQVSARGDPNMLTGLFGRTTLLSRWFPTLRVVRRNLASDVTSDAKAGSRRVDWVSGACMLARREALTEVGGFDERYFLYWEDADLCRRLRHAGWETRYTSGATAVHDTGQSSRNARALAIREFHRSAYRYFTTHVVPQWWHPARGIGWLILMLRWRIKSFER
jgi:GT2 family glycosyltransferase